MTLVKEISGHELNSKGLNIYLDESRAVTVTLYEPRHLKLTHPGDVWTNPWLQSSDQTDHQA